MAYLNTCAELDDLGKGRFRHTQHLRPVAYLENGVYRLTSRNVVAYNDGVYHHAVLTANLGVRIGDDGKYAIHPTRELARYAAFGSPMVRAVNGWQSVGFANPVRQGQSVVWQRAQADLRLTHIGHGLKHEIWLKDGYVPPKGLLAYPVDLVGLKWDAGKLLADGEIVARLQAPVVYDAQNRDNSRPIKHEIKVIDGQAYVLYTLPDMAGMAQPVVDPTLTLQPDAAAGKDARMVQDQPLDNYGVNNQLVIGNIASGDNRQRTLIAFSLAALPDDAVISSTTLSLYCLMDLSANARTFRVYRQKRAWTEGDKNDTEDAPASGATWGRYDASNNWQTAGGFGVDDCEQVDIGSRDFTATETLNAFKDFALTPVTKAALDWGNGWLLKGDTESADAYVFASSDHATAAYHPKLVVDYTLPVGGGGMLLLGVG